MKSIICFLMVSACFCISCGKDESETLLGPGIILTTDVQPQYWYDLRDYLNEHGVRITFFLPGYQSMDSTAKARTKVLIADGHEIAHHTSTHPHADEYLLAHTIDEYMDEEIFAMDKLMNADGFTTQNFAYPYGDFTMQSDEYLLKRFRSIRKIIGPYANKKIEDMDQIYYRYKGVRVFYACTIDKKVKLPVEEILDALEKARSSRSAISLYCHYIDKGEVESKEIYSLNYHDFTRIVERANKLGLKFYRACDISR